MMERFVIHFDGSCEPRNPGGIATCGWTIHDGIGSLVQSGSREVCRGAAATNNLAEWTALGLALRWLLDNRAEWHFTDLEIYGDSQLVINQLGGSWKCNKPHLIRLRDRCREILDELGVDWTARWVPREENAEADALSVSAYEAATGASYPHRRRA